MSDRDRINTFGPAAIDRAIEQEVRDWAIAWKVEEFDFEQLNARRRFHRANRALDHLGTLLPYLIRPIRSRTMADGIYARVKREVFAAASSQGYDIHSERDAALAYWHARQRSAARLYYQLKQHTPRVPTRNEIGAAKHDNRYASGGWVGSSEQVAEARAMGLTAL